MRSASFQLLKHSASSVSGVTCCAVTKLLTPCNCSVWGQPAVQCTELLSPVWLQCLGWACCAVHQGSYSSVIAVSESVCYAVHLASYSSVTAVFGVSLLCSAQSFLLQCDSSLEHNFSPLSLCPLSFWSIPSWMCSRVLYFTYEFDFCVWLI